MNHHTHSHKHLLGTPPSKQEESLRDAIKTIFKKQKKEVLSSLPTTPASAKKFKLSDKWDKDIVKTVHSDILAIFKAGGDKALKEVVKLPKAKKSHKPTTKAKASKIEIDFAEWIEDQDVLDALEAEEFLFAESISTTSADTLREALLEGMENGETIAELSDRVEELYDGWEGYRAERIARTESARAFSKGHVEAWKSTGVVKNKVWVAAADACPFCLDMDGTVVELEDNFFEEGDTQDIDWGGKEISMEQNYGDVGGPPLHPNCRCALVGQLFDDAEVADDDTEEGDQAEEEKSVKGGAGSGNFGHEGRPGEVGGSGEGDGSAPEKDFDKTMSEKTFVLPKRAVHDIKHGEDVRLVWLDTKKAEEGFKKNDQQYIGKEGEGGIKTRYPDFAEYFKGNESIEVSEVLLGKGEYSPRGSLQFINGRHRFAYMRDQGATAIPVALYSSSDSMSFKDAKAEGFIAKE